MAYYCKLKIIEVRICKYSHLVKIDICHLDFVYCFSLKFLKNNKNKTNNFKFYYKINYLFQFSFICSFLNSSICFLIFSHRLMCK